MLSVTPRSLPFTPLKSKSKHPTNNLLRRNNKRYNLRIITNRPTKHLQKRKSIRSATIHHLTTNNEDIEMLIPRCETVNPREDQTLVFLFLSWKRTLCQCLCGCQNDTCHGWNDDIGVFDVFGGVVVSVYEGWRIGK